MFIHNSCFNRSETANLQKLRTTINNNYLADETDCVQQLLELAKNDDVIEYEIKQCARNLVNDVRKAQSKQETVEAFLHEYSLSSEEGVVLMCLAEALLRIPDKATADRLIRDKIAPAKWSKHIGSSRSFMVNASTWGLMLTGKLVKVDGSMSIFSSLISRLGEPVIRTVLQQAMKVMGAQYVMGSTIELALKRSGTAFHENNRFSFDMLGESALSVKDAARYFSAYQHAIIAMSKNVADLNSVDSPSISIKLSALHPRYEVSQKERVLTELTASVHSLVQLAMSHGVMLTLDAEESDRLDLSLDIFTVVKSDESVRSWDGFGLAVQAYQKRAYPVLRYLNALANACESIIPVRLVKGAYWDTEIKLAQELGLEAYPVFTRKASTDVSYLACAKYLLNNPTVFYPQFATHNAHTLASIFVFGKMNTRYEFQRLHGMGERLYSRVIEEQACRVYAPVGSYENLLPYLVRRLLENGANTSFVNRIEDESIPIEKLVESPQVKVALYDDIPNPFIALPINIYQPERINALGINVANTAVISHLLAGIKGRRQSLWKSSPLTSETVDVINPANKKHIVGQVSIVSEDRVRESLSRAVEAKEEWKNSSVDHRIQCIHQFSEYLMTNAEELYALMVFEAGKTLADSIGEWREALDFCYYYIAQAKLQLLNEEILRGPTGEKNSYQLRGRGVFVCISPWNFPLAIFVGQVIAALLTGNVVIAKPSRSTTLIAGRVVALLHQAGIPENVLQNMPCTGETLSRVILQDARVDGVVFTGAFDTAININQVLASRKSHIVPLIAETGGLNAMIVDSSALLEQVVKDVLMSAFNSAGQRCSALRVLIIQRETYTPLLALLVEAMKELVIGDPSKIETDIPPVISLQAKEKLVNYKEKMKQKGKLAYEQFLSQENEALGHFVSPAIIEIADLSELAGEQFGPILHVMSFESTELSSVLQGLNQLGFGLTLGVHSRINETIDDITRQMNVGNLYVNRNMVGAVVGVQPFGGEGMSGTGPKAGGPNYLQRFCVEKTITTNTAAIGGNASLLTLNGDMTEAVNLNVVAKAKAKLKAKGSAVED